MRKKQGKRSDFTSSPSQQYQPTEWHEFECLKAPLSHLSWQTDLFHCIILCFLLQRAAQLNFLRCFLCSLILFSLLSSTRPFFSYLSHLPITLRSLISTSTRLFPSLFPYRHPSHITPNSLLVWCGVYWIVIRMCPLSYGFEYWTKSRTGSGGGVGRCPLWKMDGGVQRLDWQGKW